MPSEIPVIDIASFLSGDQEAKLQVARQFNRACMDVGFLVVTGHGIDPEWPEQVFEQARRFFDLPFDEKMTVKKEPGASGAGYHPFATEANAYQRGIVTPEDLRESFGLGRHDRRSGSFNRWPSEPAALKSVSTRYYHAVEELGFSIARIFSMALDLPEDYFFDKIDHHDSMMLLHHYPQQATAPLPGQLRSGQHSDLGLFTMLRMEREHRPGGLQVMNRAGQWVDVPAIPDSYTLNIGDTLMRWTNDRWISNLHRVVNPPLGSGEESRRISMPFFFAANDDATIECLWSCLAPGEAPKYAPVNAGAFRREKLRRAYDFGRMKAAGELQPADG